MANLIKATGKQVKIVEQWKALAKNIKGSILEINMDAFDVTGEIEIGLQINDHNWFVAVGKRGGLFDAWHHDMSTVGFEPFSGKPEDVQAA